MTEAIHQREVPLTGLDTRLKGVVAVASEPVLVKPEAGMAAVASALPDAGTSMDEVHAFVETLLEHNRIAFDGGRRAASKGRSAKHTLAESSLEELVDLPTHTIVTRAGKKVLTRIRFLCEHHPE